MDILGPLLLKAGIFHFILAFNTTAYHHFLSPVCAQSDLLQEQQKLLWFPQQSKKFQSKSLINFCHIYRVCLCHKEDQGGSDKMLGEEKQ